jgi:N-acyl-D-aspartate/D-glutamate deacylase
MDCPTFKQVESSHPRNRWIAELSRPELKTALLRETNAPNTLGDDLSKNWGNVYLAGSGITAEPKDDCKLMHAAQRRGCTVSELGYELMLASQLEPQLLMIAANYAGGNLDELRDMLRAPASVVSLSDAGAHLTSICDGTLHTFMLQYWVRDRACGPKLALEEVVRMMTMDCAKALHMPDRGVISRGYKADLNVLDLDKLNIGRPRYVDDLPGGGVRLMQQVSGYRATIVSGRVTREMDKATGILPGRLVRYNKLKPAPTG